MQILYEFRHSIRVVLAICAANRTKTFVSSWDLMVGSSIVEGLGHPYNASVRTQPGGSNIAADCGFDRISVWISRIVRRQHAECAQLDSFHFCLCNNDTMIFSS